MSYKTNVVKDVEAVTSASDVLRAGDPIGSFTGYMRRAKSYSAGLTAQIFGENGADADVITTLHLTRFLDANVKVTVWMIKDSNGKLMGKDGVYPKITEFVGVIKRPLASNSGQVAQFFGANGPNADAINVMNQSVYQDALVFVEMHHAEQGQTVLDIPTENPDESINVSAKRMTNREIEEAKKNQKKAHEGIEILKLSGFFRNDSVLSVLGSVNDYSHWLASQCCCHPGDKPCDDVPVSSWAVPGGKRYSGIPLCAKHQEEWDSGNTEIMGGSVSPLSFASSQVVSFNQRWAIDALRIKTGVAEGRIPSPGTIFAWAADKKLNNIIPSSFRALMS